MHIAIRKTIRARLTRLDAEGLDGPDERSAVTRDAPPDGSQVQSAHRLGCRGAGGPSSAAARRDSRRRGPRAGGHCTPDTLTTAARARGITIARSDIGRILRVEGVRWDLPRS